MSTLRETELYRPIADFLTGLGYTVRGEVKGADVAAVKGDELVIVEMKTSYTLTLILQAVERLSVTASVYVAIPLPSENIRKKKWRLQFRLLRRLGLGLIFVSKVSGVQAVFDPKPYAPRINKKRALRYRAEIAKRSHDHNVGGSTRVKLITAYREEALRIAQKLLAGASSAKGLCEAGMSAKTGSILRSNFYGWFERVSPGHYCLTADGKRALTEYKHVVRSFPREAV
ncbi:MAG: DUF2161 family putative PD-(D/E)XK-type phosphodiesterase [Spirochaetota bacterium]